jgi:phosphopantethiene--protein transferase domain
MRKRLFSADERAYCDKRNRPEVHYALRFAAKEAVMKALGTGARGLAWREIEILPNRRGKPLVYLHGAARKRGQTIGMRGIDISLTHEGDLAIAAVVGMVETSPTNRDEHRAYLVTWLREQGRL